jgi:hypothetical protein
MHSNCLRIIGFAANLILLLKLSIMPFMSTGTTTSSKFNILFCRALRACTFARVFCIRHQVSSLDVIYFLRYIASLQRRHWRQPDHPPVM